MRRPKGAGAMRWQAGASWPGAPLAMRPGAPLAILAREALARHGVLTLSTGMRVEVCERLGDIGFGHHRFTIRNVPFPYLREGAIAALLVDAGNAPTSFEVMWEGIGTLPALAAAEAPTAGNHGVFRCFQPSLSLRSCSSLFFFFFFFILLFSVS